MDPVKVYFNERDSRSVYLCYSFDKHSASGILDEADSLDDDQVKDFIREHNPLLYQYLNRLPIKSSDLPPFSSETVLLEQQTREQHARQIAEPRSKEHSISGLDRDFELLNLQLKRRVQLCLLNGHSLLLQRLPLYIDLFCDSLTCTNDGMISTETYYVTLKNDLFPSQVDSENHYCLKCLESVFDGNVGAYDDTAVNLAIGTIDGVSHDVIMKAADRVYQRSIPQRPLVPEKSILCSDDQSIEEAVKKYRRTGSKRQARIRKKLQGHKDLGEGHSYPLDPAQSIMFSPASGCPDFANFPENGDSIPHAQQMSEQPSLAQGQVIKGQSHCQTSIASVNPTGWARRSSFCCVCWLLEDVEDDDNMIECSNHDCLIGRFHKHCVIMWEECYTHEGFLCRFCDLDIVLPMTSLEDDDDHNEEGEEPHDSLTEENDEILRLADQLASSLYGEEMEDKDREDHKANQDVVQEAEGTVLENEKETPKTDEVNITSSLSVWGTPINLSKISHSQEAQSEYSTNMMEPAYRFMMEHQQATSPTQKTTTDTATLPEQDNTDNTNNVENSTSTVNNNGSSRTTPSPNAFQPYTDLVLPTLPTSASSTIHATPTKPPTLFPGSSKTTFAELAPFITTSGLSHAENRVFENWKFEVSWPPSRLIEFTMKNGCDDEVQGEEEEEYDEDEEDEDKDAEYEDDDEEGGRGGGGGGVSCGTGGFGDGISTLEEYEYRGAGLSERLSTLLEGVKYHLDPIW